MAPVFQTLYKKFYFSQNKARLDDVGTTFLSISINFARDKMKKRFDIRNM